MRYWYRYLVIVAGIFLCTPATSFPHIPGLGSYIAGLVLGGGALVTGMAWTNSSKNPYEETAYSFGTLVLIAGLILWFRR